MGNCLFGFRESEEIKSLTFGGFWISGTEASSRLGIVMAVWLSRENVFSATKLGVVPKVFMDDWVACDKFDLFLGVEIGPVFCMLMFICFIYLLQWKRVGWFIKCPLFSC